MDPKSASMPSGPVQGASPGHSQDQDAQGPAPNTPQSTRTLTPVPEESPEDPGSAGTEYSNVLQESQLDPSQPSPVVLPALEPLEVLEAVPEEPEVPEAKLSKSCFHCGKACEACSQGSPTPPQSPTSPAGSARSPDPATPITQAVSYDPNLDISSTFRTPRAFTSDAESLAERDGGMSDASPGDTSPAPARAVTNATAEKLGIPHIQTTLRKAPTPYPSPLQPLATGLTSLTLATAHLGNLRTLSTSDRTVSMERVRRYLVLGKRDLLKVVSVPKLKQELFDMFGASTSGTKDILVDRLISLCETANKCHKELMDANPSDNSEGLQLKREAPECAECGGSDSVNPKGPKASKVDEGQPDVPGDAQADAQALAALARVMLCTSERSLK